MDNLQYSGNIFSRRTFLAKSAMLAVGVGLSACSRADTGYAQLDNALEKCEIPPTQGGFTVPDDFGIHLDTGQQAWLVEHKVRDGDQSRKVAMLTYDDWASSTEFESILAAFRTTKSSKATFFINGHYLKDMAASVENAVAEGHLIGCHGWCHVNMGTYNEQEINATFAAFFNTMHDILPGYPIKFFRMPYGNTKDAEKDKVVLKIAADWGLQDIYWSFYTDGTKNNVKKIFKENIKPGSIVLCHMNYRYDLEHTPWMIDTLLNQGYTLEAVDTGIQPADQRKW